MLTFNKAHVFSNQPENEMGNDTQSPSHAVLEQEAKRKAMLTAVQQNGGLDMAECH